MTKLDQFYLEKSKKFAEICALVACELGYGELATIKSEDRHHVEREAEQQIAEWEETTELRTRSDIRPITPSRRLLSEYQNICERILDEHEIEGWPLGVQAKFSAATSTCVVLKGADRLGGFA